MSALKIDPIELKTVHIEKVPAKSIEFAIIEGSSREVLALFATEHHAECLWNNMNFVPGSRLVDLKYGRTIKEAK